ncbi:MAG TPA: Lrp/AsnC family transcriptional regulator [Candidatus Paceibacterota bacterium]|nr:Lrp/AsnC family transcriptional regulator [Candidatus Paceibacterota bacterium]
MQLKKLDFKILSELMKDARLSDREIAKRIGTSQPTVSRRRKKFEDEGLLEYIAVPALGKIGYQIIALHFVLWSQAGYQSLREQNDFMERVNAFLSAHPNIIFASSGSGLGMTRLAIAVHRNYGEYTNFRRALTTGWGDYIERFESFIISPESDSIIRSLTFKHFAKHMSESSE